MKQPYDTLVITSSARMIHNSSVGHITSRCQTVSCSTRYCLSIRSLYNRHSAFVGRTTTVLYGLCSSYLFGVTTMVTNTFCMSPAQHNALSYEPTLLYDTRVDCWDYSTASWERTIMCAYAKSKTFNTSTVFIVSGQIKRKLLHYAYLLRFVQTYYSVYM